MHCVEFVFSQNGQEQQLKKFFFAKSTILTCFKQSLKRSLHNCVNELEQVISPRSRPAMIHICPSANNALLRHETEHRYVTKQHIVTSPKTTYLHHETTKCDKNLEKVLADM